MTPALSLYLLAAARAERMLARRASRSSGTSRPRGELVWIHRGASQPANAATTMAGRLAEERPGLNFAFTSDEPLPADDKGSWQPRPADFPGAVADFLEHWLPDAAVWIGGPVWPVLAAKAYQCGMPMVLANATGDLSRGHRAVPGRHLLRLFDRIYARSEDDGELLGRTARTEVVPIGALQRSLQPLDHDEEEFAKLSNALQGRPVWYAAGVMADELEGVLAAHSGGLGASHRLLLIVQPANDLPPPRVLGTYGSRRSAQGVPAPGATVFVADLPGEEGLWYRLSSVSFVGGSLSGPQAMSDPLHAAALGSAIIHGPVISPYEEHFQALDTAGATWSVKTSTGLGYAVTDLLAPDRAAALANHGWKVVSHGAEATDQVVDAVTRLMDEKP
jgi:3-deoxy-D-manno-octulosonic-acid transferase